MNGISKEQYTHNPHSPKINKMIDSSVNHKLSHVRPEMFSAGQTNNTGSDGVPLGTDCLHVFHAQNRTVEMFRIIKVNFRRHSKNRFAVEEFHCTVIQANL